MPTIEEEIQTGLQEAYKGAQIDDEGANFANLDSNYKAPEEKKVESVAGDEEKKAEIETPAEANKGKEENGAEGNKEGAKAAAETPKSWEEQFSEKTKGKFKTWEEVESILNAPKEEYDEEIKALAELKKSGVKFDNDFWELKTKDYDKLKDPIDILKESMKWKPEYKGWSNDEIEYEIKQKYKQAEWSAEGEEPNELQVMMSKRMFRDSENDKQWLIEKKNALLTTKKPDPQAEQLALDQALQNQKNWEKFVDEEVAAKTSKLSVKLDEKESFDYEVSDSDKKEAANLMKQMPKDISVFWNLFKDGDGKLDHKKVYDMILWNKNKDNIVKIAHKTAVNKGAEGEHKIIKNTSFQANSSTSSQKADWRIAAGEEVLKNL